MGQGADTPRRFFFLDNLRTAMVFLVVLYHSGAVYESSGVFATFWLVDDPSKNDLVGMLNVIVDLLAMPVIFFVCGFLAPIGLRNSSSCSSTSFSGQASTSCRCLSICWRSGVEVGAPVFLGQLP